jgi:hypothetical protein
LSWIFLVIAVFIPLLLYRSIGESLFGFACCIVKFFTAGTGSGAMPEQLRESDTFRVLFWTAGLLFHCVLSWCLVYCGIPLVYAYTFSFAILFSACIRSTPSVLRFQWRNLIPRSLDISFVSFFSVVLVLGISIFDADNGIRTIWVNNYGDLPFHLGMIANMTFSGGTLGEYHIYPGERLSYPFLINFWTALLWSFSSGWKELSFIFMFQWVCIWTAVFFLLRKGVYGILPWVMLFSGGTIPVLLSQFGVEVSGLDGGYSHAYLHKGYPLSVFLTTIWITQRTSLLGVLIGLVCLGSFFELLKALRSQVSANGRGAEHYWMYALILFLSCILSFGLLCHFHIVALVGGYLVCLMCLLSLFSARRKWYRIMASVFIVSGLVFASPVLFFYASKSGMIQLTSGWMSSSQAIPFLDFFSSFLFYAGLPEAGIRLFAMWIVNLGVWSIIAALILIHAGMISALPFVVFFIVLNFVQLSIWDWDMIKAFIGLFVILISLQRHLGRTSFLLYTCFLVSIAPAAYETFLVWSRGVYSQVYSSGDLHLAESIRHATPPGVIIAGMPDHNTVITLSGRKIYTGYDGWLATHGIDYSERSRKNKNIQAIIRCRKELQDDASAGVCPEFFYFDRTKRSSWGIEDTRSQIEGSVTTEVEGLYRIIEK